MTIRPKLRNAALVGALATVAATAWAASGTLYPFAEARASDAAIERPDATVQSSVPVEQSLSANESVVLSEGAATPVAERSIQQPGITVEQRRLSLDERLQMAVMDKLASSQHLSGKIGVESHDAVVTLSGWTRTGGQAARAERDARSIVGVKYVRNEIRPRMQSSI